MCDRLNVFNIVALLCSRCLSLASGRDIKRWFREGASRSGHQEDQEADANGIHDRSAWHQAIINPCESVINHHNNQRMQIPAAIGRRDGLGILCLAGDRDSSRRPRAGDLTRRSGLHAGTPVLPPKQREPQGALTHRTALARAHALPMQNKNAASSSNVQPQ
eukprot:18104-Pyramimonas_sp.AAC.1